MFGVGNKDIAAQTLVQQSQADKRDREKRIKLAWQRYLDIWPKPLLATKLDPNGEDNTSINYARRTVDIGAFYLFGKGLTFQVGDAKDDPETEYLKKCWESQEGGKDAFLIEFAQGAAITGDGFLRLYRPDTAAGEKYPRIEPLDAQCVIAECDPRNVNRALGYKIEFNTVDDKSQATYHRHMINRRGARWEIVEYEKFNGPERETYRETWPYDFCPVMHCKNLPLAHSFGGLSDIEQGVLRLNEKVNFVVSSINRILRAHAHPLQYATGANLTGIDRAVGSLLVIPSKDATLGSLETLSDLTSSDEQFRRLVEALHQITSVPEIVSGKMENVGQLSGLALKILYGPLMMLTETKQLMYGPMLRKVCRAMLLMGGLRDVDESEITLKWPVIIPQSDIEEAQAAGLWEDAGVSKETILGRYGFNADEEAAKRGTEAEADLKRQQTAFNAGNVGGANPYGGQGGGNTGDNQ